MANPSTRRPILLLSIAVIVMTGCARPEGVPTDEELLAALYNIHSDSYVFSDVKYKCNIDKKIDGTPRADTAYGFELTATRTDKHREGANQGEPWQCVAVITDDGVVIAIASADNLFDCK